MTEPTGDPPKKRVGDYIRAVGAYSILLAFLAIGVTLASIFWSSANANLQIDLRRTQEKLTQAEAELAAVKTEYAEYRTQSDAGAQGISEGTASGVLDVEGGEPQEASVEVTVATEKTEAAFGGDLLISLVQTAFEGDPLRHKVIATVGSPGHPSAKIEREDVGYELMYDGKGGRYSVRVTTATTFSATFLVTRLSQEGEETPNTVGRADG